MESGGEIIKNRLKDGPDRVRRNCLRGFQQIASDNMSKILCR